MKKHKKTQQPIKTAAVVEKPKSAVGIILPYTGDKQTLYKQIVGSLHQSCSAHIYVANNTEEDLARNKCVVENVVKEELVGEVAVAIGTTRGRNVTVLQNIGAPIGLVLNASIDAAWPNVSYIAVQQNHFWSYTNKQAIEELASALSLYGRHAGFAYGNYVQNTPTAPFQVFVHTFNKAMLQQRSYVPSCAVFTKDAIGITGLFNPHYQSLYLWDLYNRIAENFIGVHCPLFVSISVNDAPQVATTKQEEIAITQSIQQSNQAAHGH